MKGLGLISIKFGPKISENIFLKISLNEYATVPYLQMKCRFSSSAHNVAMVMLRICYFFVFSIFAFFCQFYCTQTKIPMPPHLTNKFILCQLILLVEGIFAKIIICLLHVEVLLN